MRNFSREIKDRGNRAVTGFTLIELLVVVAIIGLLVTLGINGFNIYRQRARDTKRAADVGTLQKALALSFSGKASYPNPTAGSGQCLTGTDSISVQLTTEKAIGRVPVDPLTGCVADTSCCFLYTSTNGTTFTLRYTLETNSGVGTAGNHTAGPI